MGTWIEILARTCQKQGSKSRSLRGNVDRNMKRDHIAQSRPDVVPYVGTWIEIGRHSSMFQAYKVVPYVGTWIEMLSVRMELANSPSFPTWERG